MSRASWIEAPIDISGAGDNVLITGVANRHILVYKIWFVMASDVNYTHKDGATALHGVATGRAAGSFVLDYDGTPWFTVSPGNNFVLNLSGAVQVSGRVYYGYSP